MSQTTPNLSLTNLLNGLSLKTLAAIVIDLENAQEDWDYYPEDAPAKNIQVEMIQTKELILALGQKQASSIPSDFKSLLEQVRNEQDNEDWLQSRDHQEQQNWLKDYE